MATALSVSLLGKWKTEGSLQPSMTGWHHSRYVLTPEAFGKCSSAANSQWVAANAVVGAGLGRGLDRKRVVSGTGRLASGGRCSRGSIRNGSSEYGKR